MVTIINVKYIDIPVFRKSEKGKKINNLYFSSN